MQIPIRKLFLFFVSVVFMLLLLHFFPESLSSTIRDRLNLDKEANIPTWYSAVLLFLIAICSGVIFIVRTKIMETAESGNRFWAVFGLVYCFLSLDETARLHEIIDTVTSIKWVYVYAPFAALFFLATVRYFWKLRPDDRDPGRWIVGGLLVYAAGGLFSEWMAHSMSLRGGVQQLETILEEGLEMLGTIMVLMGCFQELNTLSRRALTVKISDKGPTNPASAGDGSLQ